MTLSNIFAVAANDRDRKVVLRFGSECVLVIGTGWRNLAMLADSAVDVTVSGQPFRILHPTSVTDPYAFSDDELADLASVVLAHETLTVESFDRIFPEADGKWI